MRSVVIKLVVLLAAAFTPLLGSALDVVRGNVVAAATDAAAGIAPDVLLSTVVTDLLEIVRQDREQPNPLGPQALQNKDPPVGDPALAAAVEARILPLFDFDYMTKLVVGRNWRQASAEQREALVAEFRALLVHTCFVALSNARDQAIEFKPPLALAPGEDDVSVRSYVRQSEGRRWIVDYDMKKTPAGWKIVDIKMGGLSLIGIHRDAFAAQVRDRGLDGLVSSLSDMNRRGDERSEDSRQAVPFALILMHIVTQRGMVAGG